MQSFIHPLAITANKHVSLIYMSLYCRRKTENPKKSNANTKLAMGQIKPTTFLLWGDSANRLACSAVHGKTLNNDWQAGDKLFTSITESVALKQMQMISCRCFALRISVCLQQTSSLDLDTNGSSWFYSIHWARCSSIHDIMEDPYCKLFKVNPASCPNVIYVSPCSFLILDLDCLAVRSQLNRLPLYTDIGKISRARWRHSLASLFSSMWSHNKAMDSNQRSKAVLYYVRNNCNKHCGKWKKYWVIFKPQTPGC